MSEKPPSQPPTTVVGDVEALMQVSASQSAIGKVVGTSSEHTTHNYRDPAALLLAALALALVTFVGGRLWGIHEAQTQQTAVSPTAPPVGVANNQALGCTPTEDKPSVPSTHGAAQPEALQLAFDFEQVAGNWVIDSSARGAHGWRIGSFGAGEPGHTGTGLYFDGASLVCIPAVAAPKLRTELELSVWVQPAVIDNKTRNIIARFARDAPSAFRLYLRNGYPTFWLGDARGGVSVESSIQLEAGRWHHLVARFDGTRLTLAVDGQEVVIEHQGTIPSTSAWLEIGSTPYRNEFFIGTIDELQISGR